MLQRTAYDVPRYLFLFLFSLFIDIIAAGAVAKRISKENAYNVQIKRRENEIVLEVWAEDDRDCLRSVWWIKELFGRR